MFYATLFTLNPELLDHLVRGGEARIDVPPDLEDNPFATALCVTPVDASGDDDLDYPTI